MSLPTYTGAERKVSLGWSPYRGISFGILEAYNKGLTPKQRLSTDFYVTSSTQP